MNRLFASISRIFGLEPAALRDDRLFPAVIVLGAVLGALIALTTPWKAFALVTLVVVAWLAVTRPQAVILFLVVFIPFEPFLLKFVGDDIYVYARYCSEGLVYLLLLVAVWRRLASGKRPPGTSLDLPFAFFLLVLFASWVLNLVPPTIAVLGIRQIIRFILLFFAVVWIEPDSRFIRQTTLVMFGMVVLESLLGIVQAVIGAPLDEFLIPSERRFFESIQLTSGTQQFWDPGTRIFATMGRYDQLGTFLSFFMLLAAGLAYMNENKNERRLLVGLIVLAAPALILTLSRASWFGFLLGFIAIGAVLMRDKRARFALVVAVAVFLMYWAYSGIVVKYMTDYPGQTPIERLFESFSYERWRGEYYGLGRLYWIVQTPLVVVPSSPLFGVGPGQFGGGAVAALGNTRAYEKLNLPFGVYGTEGYIDNSWFALWGETGTFGLIFYVWMVAAMAAAALKVWRGSPDRFERGLALGFFGAVLAVGFQAFLATYLEVRTLALYLWLYGAFIYTIARRQKLIG